MLAIADWMLVYVAPPAFSFAAMSTPAEVPRVFRARAMSFILRVDATSWCASQGGAGGESLTELAYPPLMTRNRCAPPLPSLTPLWLSLELAKCATTSRE